MAGTKLTDAVAKALPAPERGNKITWCASMPGFGLRVTAGGARSWIVSYTSPGGKERRMTIGAFPTWRVGQAREEARRIRRLADQGMDPLAEAEEARKAPIVADLMERYLAEHAVRKRPSSREADERMIRTYIVPELGLMKVAEVAFRDIDRLHQRVTKVGPFIANRVLSLASKAFSLAVRWGWCERNPCRGVQRNHEAPRHRFLNSEELARLSAVLATWPDRQAADIFRLLLVTGARKGEVLAMRWADLDLETGTWTRPAATTKTKLESRVPLSAAARAVLAAVEPVEGCPWVFAADSASGHREHIAKAWSAVCRAAELDGVRPHDLRHSYASVLAGQGASLSIIGGLLGHREVRTTARYAHLADNPLRQAAEAAGRAIAPLKVVGGGDA